MSKLFILLALKTAIQHDLFHCPLIFGNILEMVKKLAIFFGLCLFGNYLADCCKPQHEPDGRPQPDPEGKPNKPFADTVLLSRPVTTKNWDYISSIVPFLSTLCIWRTSRPNVPYPPNIKSFARILHWRWDGFWKPRSQVDTLIFKLV